MKFQSITMKNFMRYKGTNEIHFSTDDTKNVTVVLGDNTVGKTTIAQAFRWCLYGKLLCSKGKREEDYMLLNQTVFENMQEQAKEQVSVAITLSDDEKNYRIFRQVSYQKKASARLIEYQKKLQLFFSEKTSETEWEEVGKNEPDIRRQETIKNIVNEILPEKLSHYFLFDGEKWNDFEYSGTRENIKESVHILTGLSSMRTAMYHLKDMNSNSVIGKFRKNITGSGAVYDEIQKEIEKEQHKIEKWKEQSNIVEINIQNHRKECNRIEEFLLENQNTEAKQREISTLRMALKGKRDRAKEAYKTFFQDYSSKAFMLAVEPMVQTVSDMMKHVNLERRDIPFMKQATIDYLIERGKCICGTCIEKEGQAYKMLMDQRAYLSPADIGSLLGDFEKMSKRLIIKNEDYYIQLKEEALLVNRCTQDLEETENRLFKLEQTMDKDINFKEYKEQLKFHNDEIRKLSMEKEKYYSWIQNSQNTIQKKEQELNNLALRNQENEKWRFRAEMAKEIYDKLQKEFSSKENKVFLELNKRLQKNFYQMFNSHDKKIELDKNYNIRMYYKTDIGYREETNLSEGEKVARNFAFIVTILEFNREQKSKGDKFSDTLPIVLDGPFSKLGNENIQLVSGCLPQIAEQVVLFMLEKDWKYTGLDNFVGAKYHIVKATEDSYAKICNHSAI